MATLEEVEETGWAPSLHTRVIIEVLGPDGLLDRGVGPSIVASVPVGGLAERSIVVRLPLKRELGGKVINALQLSPRYSDTFGDLSGPVEVLGVGRVFDEENQVAFVGSMKRRKA